MKTWHIRTWGGGTPHYLVSAPTKEEAWKMVEEEWRKKYGNSYVGGTFDYYGDSKTGYGMCRQTVVDLEEIEGWISDVKMIVDLNKA